MVDLNDVAIFLKVVEAGSFSAAARLLGLPKTTVSRRVARLESALAVRLLQRTTRQLSLTDPGRAYHARCSVAVAAVEEANQHLAGVQAVPSGTIRVSAPADPGNSFLSDIVAEFLARHPEVNVELLLTDERVDFVAQRIDVAIRMGPLADSALVARKLGSGRRGLVASPRYVKAAGLPGKPADLASHACIVHGSSRIARWGLRGPRGRTTTVRLQARLAADSMAFVLRAAVAGVGIALVPEPLAARDLREGRLVPILPDYHPPETAIHLVYPSNRHLAAATRAFIDFAAAHSPRSGGHRSRFETA